MLRRPALPPPELPPCPRRTHQLLTVLVPQALGDVQRRLPRLIR